MKNSMIFMHIPKTGGVTFNNIVKKHYDKDEILDLQPFVQHNVPILDHIENICDKIKFKLLIGHQPFGLHEYMDAGTEYLTFLRQPQERIVSFYHYVKRIPKNRFYNYIHDNKITFHDFVANVKDGDLHNAQVRYISGISDRGEFMLERAIENIEKHFAFVGLLERFNESLILIKRKYNWFIPYYYVRNKTSSRPKFADFKPETRTLIEEYNKEDMLLYQYIEEKFLKEIKNAPFFVLDEILLKSACKLYSNDYIRGLGNKVRLMINN